MYIDSFQYTGWRGAGFNLKFSPGVNALVGMNGCGKTNTLELLAMMTGGRNTEMLRREGDELEYAKVVIMDDSYEAGLHGKLHSLLLRGSLDFDKINAFKDRLPKLASFVLQQDSLRDDRFVTERREPIECQKSMLEWLKNHGMEMNFYMKNGQYASLLVSETGAQRYLLTTGMRRAPAATPMLVEHPERSLHVMLKRAIPSFYRASASQQLILTTHCPEVLSAVAPDGYGGRRGVTARDNLIDMHDASVKW